MRQGSPDGAAPLDDGGVRWWLVASKKEKEKHKKKNEEEQEQRHLRVLNRVAYGKYLNRFDTCRLSAA